MNAWDRERAESAAVRLDAPPVGGAELWLNEATLVVEPFVEEWPDAQQTDDAIIIVERNEPERTLVILVIGVVLLVLALAVLLF